MDNKSVEGLETAARAMLVAKQCQEKLGNVIKYIATSRVNSEGRIEPEYQYAVRILESRQRELERDWLVTYAPRDDPRRRRAEIEQSLKNRDSGRLLRLGEKNHGVGRLDCRACDKQDSDRGKIRLARLCMNCHQGIQHVYTQKVQTTKTPEIPVSRQRVVVYLTGEVKMEPRQPNDQETCFYTGLRTYHCDSCGQISTEFDGNES